MIKNIKFFLYKKLTIKNLLIIFLIINPIFDFKIFYNSISTLIRVMCIFTFFIYYFFTSKNSKKYLLLLYPMLLAIYFVFHHINAQSFTSLVPGNFNYSIFKEALYFVKMLCPYMLIYSLYKSTININEFFKIINVLVLVISLLIITTNILRISYCNYNTGIVKANFMSWFNENNPYDYTDLLSKGPFEFGNQISAILLMFLPFTIYQYFKCQYKYISLFIVFVDFFALTLLGTRVAIIGIFIVVFYSIILYIMFGNCKEQHFFKTYAPIIVIFLIFISILPFNPIFYRYKEYKKAVQTVLITNDSQPPAEDTQIVDSAIENSSSENLNKIDFIKNNYARNNISENFILNSYPYIYDTDFWYEIISSNNTEKINVRFLEEAMVRRVVSINNNKFDKIFGITYTRIQNIFNIERDFVMQYYSLGIIGLITIFLPYFTLLLYCFIKMLNNKFREIYLINILSFITICMIFCISYYSGNLLNSLSFTIYFAIIYNLLLLRRSA